ncbi:hypothetical protein GUJ93_ZPchr0007g5775 [Zizania palustris]|uniref:Uncharacterized protein n=1 Tax=Zizania palustris TaxID=103762 RepID=A0A8J5VUF2_ZIZPA|nr:hypothetical protein GUJ93_ZPchr0007g5775 [Zizania palustris]
MRALATPAPHHACLGHTLAAPTPRPCRLVTLAPCPCRLALPAPRPHRLANRASTCPRAHAPAVVPIRAPMRSHVEDHGPNGSRRTPASNFPWASYFTGVLIRVELGGGRLSAWDFVREQQHPSAWHVVERHCDGILASTILMMWVAAWKSCAAEAAEALCTVRKQQSTQQGCSEAVHAAIG